MKLKLRSLTVTAGITLLMYGANTALAAADHDAHDNLHDSEQEHREHGAHVHGEAHMTLAVEGKQVEIVLDSPADSLLGFEHAPSTAEEKAQLENTLQQLSNPATLFVFAADAQCKSTRTLVENPYEAEHHDEHSAHADFSVEYSFECQSAQNLKTLSLPLRTVFPAIKKLTIDYVTDSAQGTQTLSDNQQQLLLR